MPAVLARLRSSPPAHEANADSRNAGHEDHDAEEPVEAGLATVPVLDSEPQDVKGRISAVPSPPFSSLIPSSAIRTRRGGATPRRAGNGSISTLHARGFELPDETRRSFTDDFKAGAVRLVLDEGKARMVVLNADSRAPPHGRTNSASRKERVHQAHVVRNALGSEVARRDVALLP
jgi:hypothetical protein